MTPSLQTSFLIPAFCLLLTACSVPSEPEGINENGMSRLAAKLQQSGDDAGAADFYQRALQKQPNDLQALRGLAGLLEAHGNIEAANDYYGRALDVAPNDADLLQARGRLLLRMGRADQARDIYQKLVATNRHDVKALNGLGISLDYLRQHAEAQKNYQLAMSEQPENLTTLNNLAHSHVLAAEYDAAIALLEPHANDPNATPGMAGMYADAERLAKKDLSPADVKKNLAYYRAHRAKVAPLPKFTADLGSYSTNEMAEARAELVRGLITDPNVTVNIVSEVQTIGGTPSFALRAAGFKDAARLGQFCEQAMKAEISCSLAN